MIRRRLGRCRVTLDASDSWPALQSTANRAAAHLPDHIEGESGERHQEAGTAEETAPGPGRWRCLRRRRGRAEYRSLILQSIGAGQGHRRNTSRSIGKSYSVLSSATGPVSECANVAVARCFPAGGQAVWSEVHRCSELRHDLRNHRYLTALAREKHFTRAAHQTVGVVIPDREPLTPSARELARIARAPDVAAALEERVSATDA